MKPPLSISLGEGLLGFAGETGRLVTLHDVENDTAIIRKQVLETGIPGYNPEVAVPMEFQGILFGVIGAGGFTDHTGVHRENLRSIGAIGAAALENVRLLERFARTTGLDRDTGLPGEDSGRRHTRPRELERGVQVRTTHGRCGTEAQEGQHAEPWTHP